MNLLSVSNVARIGREKPLFTEVTFGLNEGDKAALIGKNGCGKSTLLNTIAGVLQPDEGTVVLNKEAGVSFLPQTPLFDREDTIRAHIFKSNSAKLTSSANMRIYATQWKLIHLQRSRKNLMKSPKK